MSQGFDKYSESVGHLVMTEDGAVTNVSWCSGSDVNKATRYKAKAQHGKAKALGGLEWLGFKAKDINFKAINFGLKSKAEA